MKKFILGFLMGAMLFSILPVNAAVQQYILKKSTVKLMINGEEYKNLTLPVLLMNPGYNYLPAVSFRDIAKLMGAEFVYQNTNNTININTKPDNSVITSSTNPVSSKEITFESISSPQSGLDKLLTKDNIKFTNMNSRWYDGDSYTGASSMGAGIKKVTIDFKKAVNIKELYTYSQDTIYKFEFIDSSNKAQYMFFPTSDIVNSYYKDIFNENLLKNRCKVDLKNINRVNITVEQLFKSGEATISIDKQTDFMTELELNGTK
jgi:hypothetical protein